MSSRALPSELVAHARERIEKGSKSFSAASKLFDPQTRDAVHLLYAWCRHCDDEIDDQELGFARGSSETNPSAVLATLRAETIAALDGAPSQAPVYRGLACVAEAYDFAREDPLAHLDGFEMDVADRHYETIEETLAYCYHVAGVVGVMMARIMLRGSAEETRDTLNRASDLGIAFQLTNIARDVMDDVAIGRVYLPATWLREVGLSDVTPASVGAEDNRAAVLGVVHRMLDLADEYYDSAAVGIPRLPRRAVAAIAAARNIYRDIGWTLRAQGEHAYLTRASTSRARKLLRVSQGIGQALWFQGLPQVSDATHARDGLWTRPGG
ncbi:MAG: phytoene/squalene synthase family protein [Pseudomonadota bacterium]